METVAVIPARMGSTAYPGKPLCMIQGKTMIEHVYRRVEETDSVDETLVATPDQEIKDAVEDFGGKAVMTGTYNRPVGRVAEASKNIDADKVVTVHGDEPMIEPEMIEKTLKELDKKEVNCVNLVGNIETEEEFKDRNNIKVVFDKNNNALYYSRNPIPSGELEEIKAYKHIGVVACEKQFLQKYKQLEETPLSKTESIDILRLLEHGHDIKIVKTDRTTYDVDTPEDHEKVNKIMKNQA